MDTQVTSRINPDQWTELAPGTFTYNYPLLTTTNKRLHLTFTTTRGSAVVSERILTGITPTAFSTLDPPSVLKAGELLNVQLTSTITDFASLAANSTGWRVQLVRPDNSTADLGLMADWEVWNDLVYTWNMTVSGGNLTQVRYARCGDPAAQDCPKRYGARCGVICCIAACLSAPSVCS
jgi:hypothetical protein